MGTTHHYLELAIKALKRGGGILHYHETVPESLARTRPQERIKKSACALGKMETRRVKKYYSLSVLLAKMTINYDIKERITNLR
jgi:tRNA wybutosine-synthesizing protein 2